MFAVLRKIIKSLFKSFKSFKLFKSLSTKERIITIYARINTLIKYFHNLLIATDISNPAKNSQLFTF